MASRSSSTILVALRDTVLVARVRGGVAERVERAPRLVGTSIADLVRAGSFPGGRLRGAVWVLTDDVVAQTIEVDARTVAGLDAATTTRALAYEAQLTGGLPAADTVTAWRALASDGEQRSFWVVQAARADVEAIASSVRAVGGRCVGVASACALPRLVAPSNAASWRRVEAWPELVADVERRADGGFAVRVRRADSSRVRRDVAGEVGPDELVIAPGAPAPVVEARASFALRDDAQANRWLAAWAEELSTGVSEVPVLAPEPRAIGPRLRIGVAVAVTALALLGCAWHARVERGQRDELRRELVRLGEPAGRIAQLQQDRSRLEAERTQLLEREAATRRAPQPCAWSAETAAERLELLARAPAEGVSIEELEMGVGACVVRGLALEARHVDAFALELARRLADSGCSVTPVSKRWRADGDPVGVYEYELAVRARDGAPVPPPEPMR